MTKSGTGYELLDGSVYVSRASARGFTLIELLTVVAIIGVLSLLAVVGYRKVMNSSKSAEAIHMVGAIRIAQESIRSETGAYLNASGGTLGVNTRSCDGVCYPPGTPTKDRKVSFGGHNVALWDTLNVQSTGPVQFGYTTISGAAGETVPGSASFTVNGTDVGWPASGSTTLKASPWYIAAGKNDFDGNGQFVSIVVSSWSNGVMIDSEGE